ncbi:Biotin carboxyl carrier protein of acetyl-CoA carboxylase [bioreactor metagenome]|uniref:Biotin carboxyl carrier protein of acetyl-CoA carboxylase n=1 Tax=bioreactor metagenome TaxID=1076179 RepID=A0A644WRZ5_9ZZZZ
MEQKDVRRLAELMKEMDLTVLELSEGDSSLRMERPARARAGAPVSCEAIPESSPEEREEEKDIFTITSPMVGIFFSAPSPDSKPFVTVGERVRAGDVICIIEAMKMMNEITAGENGIVTEICAGNKQVVEFGHPLLRIRREALSD